MSDRDPQSQCRINQEPVEDAMICEGEAELEDRRWDSAQEVDKMEDFEKETAKSSDPECPCSINREPEEDVISSDREAFFGLEDFLSEEDKSATIMEDTRPCSVTKLQTVVADTIPEEQVQGPSITVEPIPPVNPEQSTVSKSVIPDVQMPGQSVPWGSITLPTLVGPKRKRGKHWLPNHELGTSKECCMAFFSESNCYIEQLEIEADQLRDEYRCLRSNPNSSREAYEEYGRNCDANLTRKVLAYVRMYRKMMKFETTEGLIWRPSVRALMRASGAKMLGDDKVALEILHTERNLYLSLMAPGHAKEQGKTQAKEVDEENEDIVMISGTEGHPKEESLSEEDKADIVMLSVTEGYHQKESLSKEEEENTTMAQVPEEPTIMYLIRRYMFNRDSPGPLADSALQDLNFLPPMFRRSEIDVTDPGSSQPGTSATAATQVIHTGSNVAYFDPVSRKVKYFKGGRPANPRRLRDGTYHGNNDVKKSNLKRKTLVVDPNIKSVKFPVEITREIAEYKKSRPKIAGGTRKSRWLTTERRTTRVSKDVDNSVSDELKEIDIADIIQSSETEIRKLKKENVKKRPSETVQPLGVWKIGLHYPPSHKLGQLKRCAFELLVQESSSSGGSLNVEQPMYVTKESENEADGCLWMF